jgi:4-hydroxy-tetrahydrodipicolinate reductase
MYRILQVGLGPLGVRIASDVVQRKLGAVVAAVDSAGHLVGKPLSSVVPGSPDTPIAASIDDLPQQAYDLAIVSTRSELPACAPTLRALLERRLSVISTCEELAWPWLRHAALGRELDELAQSRGARLLGTGINPGFLMDALPVLMSTACGTVKRVTAYRIQDALLRRIPFQQKIGVGMERARFEREAAARTIGHVGLGESLHFLAHYLGFTIDRWDETIEPVIAERALDSGIGPVTPGSVCGVRQQARGFQGEHEVICLVFQAAIGQPEPHDRIVIKGDPPIDLVIHNGVHGDVATSAVVLNAARGLLAAPPGLQTMATIALQGCTPPRAR